MTLVTKRSTYLALVALIVAGCGGGGGSPAAPTDPTLSNNLAATFGASCTVSGGLGTALVLTFDYTDAEGDVRGGHLTITATFNIGPTVTLLGADVPSATVTITGTTSGTITARPCVRFASATSVTVKVAVTDVAGHSSNELSTVVLKPAGAPERPAGG